MEFIAPFPELKLANILNTTIDYLLGRKINEN